MRIYYGREKNGISAVGVLCFFCGAFSSGELSKSKIAEFSGGAVPKLAKSGKKREIRLETAEKRLLAAMKGRYSSEKVVKRRKPAKKREKRKKIKKF